MTATSVGRRAVSATRDPEDDRGRRNDTLLVDNDGNDPDVAAVLQGGAHGANVSFSTGTSRPTRDLPQAYLTAHKNVVWFTGNSYPAPITPYEGELKAFLDGGGRLLMSGQDILDQAAGTTPFVHDYLHITWDGTEAQNDKADRAVTASPATR